MDDNKVALYQYMNMRFDELEKRFNMINSLNTIALDKATDVIDDRLAQMNEFRAQMKDQQNTFATKVELENNNEKIDKLESYHDKLEGKASARSVIFAYVLAAASLLISIAKLI